MVRRPTLPARLLVALSRHHHGLGCWPNQASSRWLIREEGMGCQHLLSLSHSQWSATAASGFRHSHVECLRAAPCHAELHALRRCNKRWSEPGTRPPASQLRALPSALDLCGPLACVLCPMVLFTMPQGSCQAVWRAACAVRPVPCSLRPVPP